MFGRYFTLVLLTFAGLCLASCSEDDGTVQEFVNWQQVNADAFRAKYDKAVACTDGTMKVLRAYSKNTSTKTPEDFVVVEVLQNGTGSGCPLYTDSVRVHYLGRLLPSTTYAEGYVFDSGSSDGKKLTPQLESPVAFALSELVTGFTTAVMNMHIGDVWRVYIPQQLGYGTAAHSGIPAYSTLVFDIGLAAYYKPGSPSQAWKSKKQ